jgi:hypothetical protein
MAPLLPTGKTTKSTDILLSIYGSSDVKLWSQEKSNNSLLWHHFYQLEKRTDILLSIYGSSDVKLWSQEKSNNSLLPQCQHQLTMPGCSFYGIKNWRGKKSRPQKWA